MVFTRSAASQMRAWQSRPTLGRTGTKPVGARPLVLAIALAVALAIHGFQRAHNRSAEIHGDIVGKAWVIDGDTIDISGSRLRLQGIDAPESNQTCTDAGNRAWQCGRAATRELIELIAGRFRRECLDGAAGLGAGLLLRGLSVGGGAGACRQARDLVRKLHAALGMATPASQLTGGIETRPRTRGR